MTALSAIENIDQLLELNVERTSPESLEGVRSIAARIAERYDREYWLRYAREERFAPEQWQAFADAGLLRLSVPIKYGGAGLGMSENMAVMETLAEAGVANHFFIITTIAQMPLAQIGTPEQVDRYLRPTMTGEKKPCVAITEPVAGTNLFKMSTTARRSAEGWTLNGEKIYITGADEAAFMLIIARTPDEPGSASMRGPFSLFLVDMDTPGLRYEIMEMDLGWPEKHCRVFLENVQLPLSALLGEVNVGLDYLWNSMNSERLMVPGKAIGLGRFALSKAIRFAQTREPFDRPIGAYQAVQHPLARAEMHLRTARLSAYDAAARFDRGERALAEVNIAKFLASEACIEAVTAAIQVCGGRGFDSSFDLMSLVPVAHLTARGPINNEMVLNFVGERVLGLPRSY